MDRCAPSRGTTRLARSPHSVATPQRRRRGTDAERQRSLAEHFGVEPPDAGPAPPRIGRQAGLDAGLLQELRRPSSRARSRPAAAAARAGVHARRRGRGVRSRRRQGRSDRQARAARAPKPRATDSGNSDGRDGFESRILGRRIGRAAHDIIGERSMRIERAETSAQLVSSLDRHEHAGRGRQVGRAARPERWRPPLRAFDCFPRQIAAERVCSAWSVSMLGKPPDRGRQVADDAIVVARNLP